MRSEVLEEGAEEVRYVGEGKEGRAWWTGDMKSSGRKIQMFS